MVSGLAEALEASAYVESEMKRWLCYLAPVAIAGGLVDVSRAAVLEIEPFNYPSNLGSSVNGLNGGTGWGANAWQDADADITLATTNTSLDYPLGSPLPESGSRLLLSTADTDATATRLLGTTMNLSTSGQNWYSSALFRRSAETGEATTISFSDNSTADNIRWFYGIDANGNFTVAVNPQLDQNQRATTTTVAAADTTYLVVARIRTNTFTGGNDEVFLKVFGPNDPIVEPANDAAWDLAENGNSGVTLSKVTLAMTNAAGQTNAFDEFRVGTTFQDVTGVPEPTGLLAAAAFCTGGLLMRRRRVP